MSIYQKFQIIFFLTLLILTGITVTIEYDSQVLNKSTAQVSGRDKNIEIGSLLIDSDGNSIVAINYDSFVINGYQETTIQKLSRTGKIEWRLYLEQFRSLKMIIDHEDHIYVLGLLEAEQGILKDKFNIFVEGLIYLIVKIDPNGGIDAIQYYEINTDQYNPTLDDKSTIIIDSQNRVNLILNNINYQKLDGRLEQKVVRLNRWNQTSCCNSMIIKLNSNLEHLVAASFNPIAIDFLSNHLTVDDLGNMNIINNPSLEFSLNDSPKLRITTIDVLGVIRGNQEVELEGELDKGFKVHEITNDESGNLIILYSTPVSSIKTLYQIYHLDKIEVISQARISYEFELYSDEASYQECLADDNFLQDVDCDVQNLKLTMISDRFIISGETPVKSLVFDDLPNFTEQDNSFNEDLFLFSLSNTLNLEWGYYIGKSQTDRLLNIRISDEGSSDPSIHIHHENVESKKVYSHKISSDGTYEWFTELDDSILGDYALKNPFFVFENDKSTTSILTWLNDPISNKDTYVKQVSQDGTTINSQKQGGSENDVFTHAQQLSSNSVIAAGYTTSTNFPLAGPETSFNGIIDIFIFKISLDGNIAWSLYIGNRDEIEFEPPDPSPLIIIIAVISAIALLIYFLRSLILARQAEKIVITETIETILGEVFNHNTPFMYVFLGGKAVDDSKYMKEIRSQLPIEIIHYKFLMHPIRLSILKILNDNMRMSTIELKERLGANWSEFNNHLQAMIKNGVISSSQEFVGGNVRKLVLIEPQGVRSFEELRMSLINFLTDDSLHEYLDLATSIKNSLDNLYPNE